MAGSLSQAQTTAGHLLRAQSVASCLRMPLPTCGAASHLLPTRSSPRVLPPVGSSTRALPRSGSAACGLPWHFLVVEVLFFNFIHRGGKLFFLFRFEKGLKQSKTLKNVGLLAAASYYIYLFSSFHNCKFAAMWVTTRCIVLDPWLLSVEDMLEWSRMDSSSS